MRRHRSSQLLGVGLVIGGIAAATLPMARLRDGLAAGAAGPDRELSRPTRRVVSEATDHASRAANGRRVGSLERSVDSHAT